MQVGSIIKSFDFPGNLNCYMVGEVIEISKDEITCKTIKQVFDGKTLEIDKSNKRFRTMRNGTGFFDNKFALGRVVVVG